MEEKIETKKKKRPVWLIIVIALAVFFVFIIAIIGLGSSATSAVAKPAQEQLTLFKSGNLKEAYELTSKEFQNTVSFDQFSQFVKQYPILTKYKSYSFSERSFENNVGLVKGTITGEDGSVQVIQYQLVKENGEWKILNVSLNPSEETKTTEE